MSRAWVLTHDVHIDRRIYSFVEVFHKLGHDVKLFASNAPPADFLDDPAYIIRPTQSKTLYARGQIHSDIKWENEKPIDLQYGLARIVKAQERYYSQNNAYSANLHHLLDLVPSLESLRCEFRILLAGKKGFIVAASQGPFTAIYNSHLDSTSWARRCDDPAVRQLSYLLYHKVTNSLAGTFQPRMPPAPDSGIQTGTRNSPEGTIYWSHNASRLTSYEYRPRQQVVIQRKPLDYSPLGMDSFAGREYDFISFRKAVFDYSPILRAVQAELDRTQSPPDIVYVADLPTLPIGYMVKQSLGCKLIVDCHEWWKEQAILWNAKDTPYIRVSDDLEKQLYAQCDQRITVGRELAKAMSRYFGCPFESVYSSTASGSVEEAKRDHRSFWQERLKLPSAAKIAVFQGSITTLRNLDNLARATRYLSPNHALVIVGDGPYRTEFEQRVKAEGNPYVVFYMGWVSQGELWKYTCNADLGIIPYMPLNYYYSLSVPNKLFEYIAAQLPILCDYRMKEIFHIVDSSNVGMGVDCSNPEVLGHAINECLGSPNRLAQWKTAYQSVAYEFSHAGQEQHIVSLFSESLQAA